MRKLFNAGKNSKKAAAKLIVLLVMGAFLAKPLVAHGQSRVDEVQKSGTIRAAIAIEPPLANIDANGRVTGAAPEVLRAAMAELGVKKIDAQVTEWGAMIPGLLARRFDVIATGLFMRPERCKSVLYSQPDICTAHTFAVKKGNPLGLVSIASLKAKGAKLGVCGGCRLDKDARAGGVSSANIVIVTDPLNGLQMLKTGRIDALGYPDLSLTNAVQASGIAEVEILPTLEGSGVECAGVAFHPQDKQLRDAYDEALAKLKASGEFAKILKPWGINPQIAIDTTRESLCTAK